MALDCVITVKAAKGNGALSKDTTGPVSRFIRDSDYYYTAVYQHVCGSRRVKVSPCGKCDPNEVLEGFLENRHRKMYGRTSDGLIKMAFKYRRALPSKVDKAVVAKFVLRGICSAWGELDELAAEVEASEDDCLRAVQDEVSAWRSEVTDSSEPILEALRKSVRKDEVPRLSRLPDIAPFADVVNGIRRGLRRPLTGRLETVQSAVYAARDVDYRLDEDPSVRKAVKAQCLFRLSTGSDMRDRLEEEIAKRTGIPYVKVDVGSLSDYVKDEDDELASIARELVVRSVMTG